jgi:protein involved in polysaccharide export with SLBB domain
VPNLYSDSKETDTSEWVGIDGVDNSNLIQAGVNQVLDPTTNRVTSVVWWEILPAPMTPVYSVRVSPGDQVSVSIWQISGSTWQIQIVNNTNGQSFNIQRQYYGPGSSAEWIVEAPTSSQTGAIVPLGGFNPNVTFTNDRYGGGPATSVTKTTMMQDYRAVATPGPMNANGNFTVAWGGVAPPAP